MNIHTATLKEARLLHWVLFLFVAVAIMLAIAVTLGKRGLVTGTDIPPTFSEISFRSIAVGTPVDQVFADLGYPYSYVVHSLRPGGTWDPPVNWSLPTVYSNINDVTAFVSNSNCRVVLRYSQPRDGCSSYYVRQIAILNGRVINVDGYSHFGFFD